MPNTMENTSHHAGPAPRHAGVCPAPRLRFEPRRWALASVGVMCVGMGALGVVLPGLPTTIFLIIACACFTKSCPPMERWVRQHPLFRPYAVYLDPDAVMPRRARVISITLMWLAILASAVLFWRREIFLPWAGPLLLAAGIVGTVSIVRFRRGRSQGSLADPALDTHRRV
jgi:uncharacterized membrane protein YbaN (DUF454 family)